MSQEKKVCGACEDAARICLSRNDNRNGYISRKREEARACAAAIRASCRHSAPVSDEALLRECRERAAKFVAKVRDGRAQSKETFSDMIWIVENIDARLSSPAAAGPSAEDVRAECAKICDELNDYKTTDEYGQGREVGLKRAANTIRALDLTRLEQNAEKEGK